MRSLFFICGAVFLTIAIGLCVLFLGSPEDGEVLVRLEAHEDATGDADRDGDGTPDWLEEITGSDSFNATSFPYQRDIARAGKITVDDLLYGGPGGITEEIVTRILLGGPDSSSVTEEEEGEFITTSVNYFLRKVEERGVPPVFVTVDDTVSRAEVLDQFVSAAERFEGVSEHQIEELIFEVFAKNMSISEDAQRMRNACRFTLEHLPRRVPSATFDSYYLVVERITYLCESLYAALSDNGAENFFYVLQLMSSGRLFENLVDAGPAVEETVQNRFLGAMIHIVRTLQE